MSIAAGLRATIRPLPFVGFARRADPERREYYGTLERTQKGDLDVMDWQLWFLGCLQRAIDNARHILDTVLTKAQFWERFAQESLNERQIMMLNRLLDGRFEGKLTSSRWAKMTKTSQDTLRKNPGGGRSTSYSLAT